MSGIRRQSVVRGAILASVLIGSVVVAPVRAAGLKTYVNAKHGYSIQYPGAWHRKPDSQNDFVFDAPDGNAEIAGVVFPSQTKAQLLTLAVNELKSQKAKAATIKTGTIMAHGVTFLTASGTIPGNGAQLHEIIQEAEHAKQSYGFVGDWALGQSSTPAEQAEVQAFLQSITFRSPAK